MSATTNDLLIQKTKVKKTGQHAWAISYGDMVTVLLCFFIIFYAIEKQMVKKGIADELNLSPHSSSDVATQLDYAVATLGDIPGVQVTKTSAFVDINFKKIIFFGKGEYKLTADGKNTLDEVLLKMKNLQDKYLLEVQGHADSTPVANIKGRWWKSNIELSVLRALNVHNYIAENYTSKNHLIVSGHGTQKDGGQSDRPDDLDRKISLRLQLIK
jgi:chemotaxis protein MotB